MGVAEREKRTVAVTSGEGLLVDLIKTAYCGGALDGNCRRGSYNQYVISRNERRTWPGADGLYEVAVEALEERIGTVKPADFKVTVSSPFSSRSQPG